MRKNVFGRKFKRDTNERKALFKGLISSLIFKGKIQTTLEKAKAIKGDIDKIVNKAKKGGKIAEYLLQSYIPLSAIEKAVNDVAPRLNDRNSGYTKISRLGKRFSDNASMVLMEWTVPISNIKNKISNIKGEEGKIDKKIVASETRKKREIQKQ